MTIRRVLARLASVAAALSVSLSVAAAAAPRVIPGELIVKYRTGVTEASKSSARARVPSASRVKRFDFIRAEHVRFSGMSTEQAIATLRRDPSIEYVEPNYEWTIDVVPNDTRFSELYGMRNTGQTGGTPGADIRATAAWDVFTGDASLKVGVIDTGVDYNHPDLAANAWTNPGEIPGNNLDDDGNGYVDDIHGYDFVNDDGDPFDDNGHGTHCAGTIAGVGNNGLGVTGVVWSARIIGIKFLGAGGSGSTDDAIAGVQYAIAVGCRLTSNSWGGGGFSQALLDAIDAAGAADQLFIAAAGNAGSDNDASPSYPASYTSPYIVSVAATDDGDQLASFSNYGATSVDLGAPGVDILSCQPGGGYQTLSGTSMATPHVAGAAALARGRFPGATNLQIKQLLLLKADPIASLSGRTLTGARLNAFLSIADPDSLPPGGVIDLATNDAGSTTMGLVWTATGDDAGVGRASRYDIRWSTSPIDTGNFLAAHAVEGPDPQVAGSPESFEVAGLTYLTTYYFALRALDEFGNAGPISNLATGTTLGIPNIAVSPPSLTETLLTGATSNQTLSVSNTGAGRLDWTAPTPEVLLGMSGLVAAPQVFAERVLAKGEEDPSAGILGAGGPDAFGYRWIDSDDPGGPAFSWVDITGVGTPLSLTGDDALSAAVGLGFSFSFYGSSFNSVRVATNGTLTFTDTNAPYSNGPLPTSGGSANMIAPFWDDLDFGLTPRVWTHYDGTRFIVSWIAAPHYSSGGPYTFQAILYPSGEIRYQYLSMAAPTNSATVGIQNGTETVGLTAAYNTSFVHDAMAVRILPLKQWMTVAPGSGRLAAGASQDVTVSFDASGLNGGVYQGNVRFLSNDPDGSPHQVPTQLTVIGAPNVVATPDPVVYGQQYAGGTYTRTLVVANNGTDALTVTSIAPTGSGLSATPGSFVVAASGAQNVTVTWNPPTPGALAGSLAIASDDPDTPTRTVVVTGEAVTAPSFTVDPTSLEETLNTNTAISRTVRISNTGGSDLVFNAASVLAASAQAKQRPAGDADVIAIAKGAPDVQFGVAPLAAGGPDAFGYRWSDSNEPGGPVFDWVEIAGVGTPIAFTGDDQNLGPFPIGFAFPYYGTAQTTFRMCTNGWLSFTSGANFWSNTTLPSSASGAPENLLAPFWDDLDFSLGGTAWYHNDGTRLIVEWKEAHRLSESGPTNTFQVLLYPDGRIVYQYLTMDATTRNSHTIGLQNATRDDGLLVVFNNAAYLADDKAVQFRPPARFLTVTPASGTVPAQSFVDLTVGFNAAGLTGGDYSALVRITSNDPIVPQYDVPALLHVIGVPDIVADPGSLPFDSTYIGYPSTRQVTVRNTGSDALVVDEFTFDDPAFATSAGSVTIPPGGSNIINVTFSPSLAQGYAATMTVKSDDPDTPQMPVPLAGTGRFAPDQAVSGAAFSSTLAPATQFVHELHLSNSGGSNLHWTLGASVNTASAASYTALALKKDEADPRTGILGAGGPDAFGYRWKDSDAPGGPAFSWVDITGVGTALGGMAADDRVQTGVPIGFPFKFYGVTHTTVNVCTNGWLSFTETDSAYSNQPLPNAGSRVPANLVAPFWDDMDLRSAGAIYTHSDGSRFVVSWVGVPHYTSGGPYTFQAILYPSGRIVYQYLTMASVLESGTIGIQNATRDVGLQSVFNAAYVHDGLAAQYSALPTWAVAGATSGTLAPGTSIMVPLTFDATDLELGTYLGNLRISSNDPDEGVTDIPLSLHVSSSLGAGDALPRAFGLRLASRNPGPRGTMLELALPQRSLAEVDVHDVRGARVQRIASGEREAGVHRLQWDGRDSGGRRVAAGMYFVRARTAGGLFQQRVVVMD